MPLDTFYHASPIGNRFVDSHHDMMDLDADPVVVHDAWAAPPMVPGVWDMDLAPATKVEQPKYMYSPYSIPLPLSGFATPASASQPLSPGSPPNIPLPPAPRPAELSLAPCTERCQATTRHHACEDEDEDGEEIRRGRSPGPNFVPPPAPRLDGKELPGANPGPPPAFTGTRPGISRGYSALGLELTPAVPISSISPPASLDCIRRSPVDGAALSAFSKTHSVPHRSPLTRRGKSDDLHDRISNWCGAVAAANSHVTPVHSSSRPWADDLHSVAIRGRSFRPPKGGSLSTSPTESHAAQLDPWAARIGRSRGRALDMPTMSSPKHTPSRSMDSALRHRS